MPCGLFICLGVIFVGMAAPCDSTSTITSTSDHARSNVCRTRPSACSIDLRGPDLILGADIVWIPELVSPLVNALKWLTEKDPESGEVGAGAGDVRPSRRTQVLIAHQTRSRASDQLLYKTLEDQGFQVEPIPRRAHHRDYEDQAIDILQIERR